MWCLTAVVLLGICLPALLLIGYLLQYGYWRRRGVDGPVPVPLFGNLLDYVLGRKHYGEVYGEIYR